MPSLDDAFQQLIGHLREPGSLSASRSDPFYYLVYPPKETLEIKRRIPTWSAQLRNAGMEVIRVSFSDLLWELIDASQRWEAWLEVEHDVDQEQVNDAIRNVSGQFGLHFLDLYPEDGNYRATIIGGLP